MPIERYPEMLCDVVVDDLVDDRRRYAKWSVHCFDAQWSKVMELIRSGESLSGIVRYVR